MTIKAKVICDSVTPDGDRLTTMEVEFPRFILAEFNTHRVFSRNSASSRAIPVHKIMERVDNDPYVPEFWGMNQSGMQAQDEEIPNPASARDAWLAARRYALRAAGELTRYGLHKQWANRLIEPFMWHKVIVTSHEWDNFFDQRCSPLAQPEMQQTAEAMHRALDKAEPRKLTTGQWHLPYVFGYDAEQLWNDEHMNDLEMAEVSAARCARVSYLNHDKVRSVQEDVNLFTRLTEGQHASPLEHPACVAGSVVRGDRNFGGAWLQLRQIREL